MDLLDTFIFINKKKKKVICLVKKIKLFGINKVYMRIRWSGALVERATMVASSSRSE